MPKWSLFPQLDTILTISVSGVIGTNFSASQLLTRTSMRTGNSFTEMVHANLKWFGTCLLYLCGKLGPARNIHPFRDRIWKFGINLRGMRPALALVTLFAASMRIYNTSKTLFGPTIQFFAGCFSRRAPTPHEGRRS